MTTQQPIIAFAYLRASPENFWEKSKYSVHSSLSLLLSQTAIEASFGAQSERAAAAAACARHSAELVALRKRNAYVEQQIQTELADKVELIAQVNSHTLHKWKNLTMSVAFEFVSELRSYSNRIASTRICLRRVPLKITRQCAQPPGRRRKRRLHSAPRP